MKKTIWKLCRAHPLRSEFLCSALNWILFSFPPFLFFPCHLIFLSEMWFRLFLFLSSELILFSCAIRQKKVQNLDCENCFIFGGVQGGKFLLFVARFHVQSNINKNVYKLFRNSSILCCLVSRLSLSQKVLQYQKKKYMPQTLASNC